MIQSKENPRCAVHYYGISGRCSCSHECNNCGVTYVGEHSKDDCIMVLKNRLRLDELADRIEVLSACNCVGSKAGHDKGCPKAAQSREELIAAAKADLLANLPTKKRSCNRHNDCDAAEQEVMTRKGITRDKINYTFHCHDDECEDCFGR